MAETYEGRPCKTCGGTVRYKSGGHCIRYTHADHPGVKYQRASERRRAERGLCAIHGCPLPRTRKTGRLGSRDYTFCERHGREKAARRLKEWTVNDEQDLSAFPVMAKSVLPGGFRCVSFFAPWPAKTKHTRTALTARAGFRPLVKAAKQYQNFIAQAVLVNDAIGWIREGTEYILEVITLGHRSDNDQYTGGLQDDLVKSGLMANDRHCEATVSRRYNIPKDQEKKLFVCVYETQKGEE